jgi:hypothetical protein
MLAAEAILTENPTYLQVSLKKWRKYVLLLLEQNWILEQQTRLQLRKTEKQMKPIKTIYMPYL